MEWSESRAFNPMNSVAKGLTYYDSMVKILGWLDGKNELPSSVDFKFEYEGSKIIYVSGES